MLTKRVIPCLDVKDGRVVKGVNFVSLRDAGDPVELAAAYDRAGADEVVFLDITATSDGRATTIDMASHASEELSIPYAVAVASAILPACVPWLRRAPTRCRSIRRLCATRRLLPRRLQHLAAKLWCAPSMRNAWASPALPALTSGKCLRLAAEMPTGLDAVEWAAQAAQRGAGEILLTSMDRDGTKAGFDVALTRAVARAVSIPVIASGGVGELEHFAEGVIDGEADAVLAAKRVPFRPIQHPPGEGIHGQPGHSRAA